MRSLCSIDVIWIYWQHLFSYYSLSNADRKRLELDEDRLLAVMLYNLIAFMILMRVSKEEIRRKIRRILGRCHIGLMMSQQVNELLDNISNLVKQRKSGKTKIQIFSLLSLRAETMSTFDPSAVVFSKSKVLLFIGVLTIRATCYSWKFGTIV